MVHLVNLDDESENTTTRCTYLCSHVQCNNRMHKFKDILAVIVPNAFTRIQEIIQTKGILRRAVASKGIVYSYDSNGQVEGVGRRIGFTVMRRITHRCVLSLL